MAGSGGDIMAVSMRPVFSSHVQAIGYDAASSELHVAYKNGSRVAYKGVPQGVANKVMQSPSIGSALHSMVKGSYAHRYLEG